MSTLNTKGMSYHILRTENFIERHTVCTLAITLFLFLTFPLILPKSMDNEIQKILTISVISLFLIATCLIETKPYLYLWAHNQNSGHITISKSEVMKNILSNDCKFIGSIFTPIENKRISKTCIKIPLTNEEYEKIIVYLEGDKKREEKCMNPDITIEK